MIQIDLAGTGKFQIEPARDVLRMYPAIGGAQLQLSMRISRLDERKDSPQYQVTASMTVGRMAHQGHRFLCEMRAKHLVNPATQATEVTLYGFVTDQQLRVIEAIRQGNDLSVNLDLQINGIDGEPGRFVSGAGSEAFYIQSGEWAAALERGDAGSYVELLVPLPKNQQNANAVRRLGKARQLMRDDQREEALGETRKAIEKVRNAYQTGKMAAGAAKKDPRQHSKEERWALFVESIFSLLSGAVHDDEGTTENFQWSRSEAYTLLVSTAGMLAQLVEDEQEGSL